MKQQTTLLKDRLLAGFLAMFMVFGMMPSVSFAVDYDSATDGGGAHISLTSKVTDGSGSYQQYLAVTKTDLDSTIGVTRVDVSHTTASTELKINASSSINTNVEVIDKEFTTAITADVTTTFYYTLSSESHATTYKEAITTSLTFTPEDDGSTTNEPSFKVTASEWLLYVNGDGTAEQPATADLTEILDKNGTTGTVSMVSSVPTVVTVANDVVTAVGEGKATVTATYTYNGGVNSINSTISFVVKDMSEDPEVDVPDDDGWGDYNISMKFSSTERIVTAKSGSSSVTENLTIDVSYKDGSPMDDITAGTLKGNLAAMVKYTATDYNVVDIVTKTTTSITCTGLMPGTTLVTASIEDLGISASFNFIMTGIIVPEPHVNLVTNTQAYPVTVQTFGSVGTLQWLTSSANWVSVATDSADGTTANLTTGTEPGTVTITVKDTSGNSNDASFTVTVDNAVATPITATTSEPLYFSSLVSQGAFQTQCNELFPGDTIVSLTSLSVPIAAGILYLGYQSEDSTGAGVGSALTYHFNGTPSVSDIVYVPSPTYTASTATIVYNAKTAAGNSFSGEIVVTITDVDSVDLSTPSQTPITLSSSTFSQVCSTKVGQALSSVVFTLPEENQAFMYYDYVTSENYHHLLATGETVVVGDLDKITVIPSPGFTGYLTIPYTGTAKNGMTYQDFVVIYVTPHDPSGPIAYNTIQNQYVTFVTSDFHANSQSLNWEDVDYVTFTLPDPSVGTLYELYISENNYRKLVTADTSYNAGSRSPEISEVSFVPASGFTGSIDIPFVGTTLSGRTYQGTVEVNVGTQSEGDISYICSYGGYVPFFDGDFNQLSQDLTGSPLDYISFTTLPAYTSGTVRIGQSTSSTGETNDGYLVGTNSKYYYGESPLVSKLTFQANAGFTGFVSIPFTGVAKSGAEFSAKLTVVVSNQNLVSIPYTATRFEPATMATEDFQHYSLERTGTNLDYVRFELPDSSVGTFYYDYTSSTDYGSLVYGEKNYYATAEDFLGNVTFVPHSSFRGTAQISFTGWSVTDQEFSGIISIFVSDSGDPLSYTIRTGGTVYLSNGAFDDFCKEETGSSLHYITFQGLPTSSQGRLYSEYDSSDATNTVATTTLKYYSGQSPYIKNMAFVAGSNYLGSVELEFTAYAVDGSSAKGVITIVVLPSEASTPVYYYTSFSAVQFKPTDFNDVWSSGTVETLQLHNIPTASQGKLYYTNNVTAFATTSMIYSNDSNATYYIGNIVFAPKAGYSGVVSIAYTATTTTGQSFSGEIAIDVAPGQRSTYFLDMDNHLWATAAADYLYIASVSTGTGNNNYGPSTNISRGDFALMLMRAMRFTNDVTGDGFSDVSSDDYYYTAIQSLKNMGIVAGNNGKYSPTASITRQDAMLMLQTAMEVASKSLPAANTNVLTRYGDSGSVASYATGSLSIMVQAGVISGDNSGNLNPVHSITRAEMAVVLHQAMTY